MEDSFKCLPESLIVHDDKMNPCVFTLPCSNILRGRVLVN